MARLTIKDIAKICGVGVSTVSRAINNDPGINEKTKKKVLQVIQENNYIPNNSARNLKRMDSNTIALLIKGIENEFFQGMLSIFEEELKKLEYSFLIHAVGEDQDDASVALELAMEKRLKGIIFLGGLMDYPEQKLDSMGIPYVLCTVAGNIDAPKRKCSSISIDDEKEGYNATNYLCKLGHKRIAFLAGREEDYSVARLRMEGYKRALEENNIEFDPALVRFMKEDIPVYTAANGYQVTKEMIEEGIECTAICAVSDITAFGAYRAIYEAGKKIPEDYSVIGFDAIELSKFYQPSLTSIKQPCREMVETSIKLLMDEIVNENNKKERVLLDATLIERESTRKIN